MFCVLCWDVEIVLGLIGTPTAYFVRPVGAEKRTNKLLEGANNKPLFDYQVFNAEKCPWLGRWHVGTENGPHGN